MKKTVNYQGQKIKVDFAIERQTKIVDEMVGVQISRAHGTKRFVINGKSYLVHWELKRNPRTQRSSGVKLFYKGFSCPDNEKQMIEHIIAVNGI